MIGEAWEACRAQPHVEWELTALARSLFSHWLILFGSGPSDDLTSSEDSGLGTRDGLQMR